jgi:allantoin racemase
VKPDVFYLMPARVVSRLGAAELGSRREILTGWAGENARIEVGDLEEGPLTIESFSDETLASAPAAERVRQIVESGFHAIIMGCFADTILDAARELSPGPVVGPAQASMHYAAMLGERFSILTPVSSVIPMIRRLVRVYGMDSHLASIEAIGASVTELSQSRHGAYHLLLEHGKKAIEHDGAEALILGCMSMAFEPQLAERLQNELGVPVLNPARIALDVAISLSNQNLSQRSRSHRTSPIGIASPREPRTIRA